MSAEPENGIPSRREETLARLDAIQAGSLRRLQAAGDGGADRALLVELLESACLLELAKIDTTRIDPTGYVQLAVDVIAQLYPVRGIAVTLAVAGDRPVEVHAGVRPDGDRRFALVHGDDPLGVLLVGAATADLGDDGEFFHAVAGQLAQGYAAATRSEELRREAATATASRVASQLADDRMVDGLEELAFALASFPSVIAAELVVDHVAVGAPLRLRSGSWDGDGHAHSVENVTLDLGSSGRLTARIRSADEASPEPTSVHGVIECLARSLDAIATTQALREQAETDSLTGLGNRRRLQRALEQHLNRARRYGECVALLLLDLDRFKAVNDELGHDTGDAVIVACAQALRERTRSYDELVRLGGDEFVVVAPVPDVLDARSIAGAVRDHVGARCNAILPPDWGLSAAVGVAVFPDSAADPESLLRAADVALYRAKDGAGVIVADAAEPGELMLPAGRTRRRRSARRHRPAQP